MLRISQKANKNRPVAKIELKKEDRLSLKRFSPRQTRAGVSYRTSPKRGRKTAPGAFMGPRPGLVAARLRGHVFKRVGKNRQPITRLDGASPWGAYLVNRLDLPTVKETRTELTNQVRRRIRFRRLKAAGGLRGKQR